jgi:hypothetical protein
MVEEGNDLHVEIDSRDHSRGFLIGLGNSADRHYSADSDQDLEIAMGFIYQHQCLEYSAYRDAARTSSTMSPHEPR